jgi:hypothetical protein
MLIADEISSRSLKEQLRFWSQIKNIFQILNPVSSDLNIFAWQNEQQHIPSKSRPLL